MTNSKTLMNFRTGQELSDGFGEGAGISSCAVVSVTCGLDCLSWEIYWYKLQSEYGLW